MTVSVTDRTDRHCLGETNLKKKIYTHITRIYNVMLNFITDAADPLLDLVKDDPVRPEIPREFRVSDDRFVAVLT